MTIWGIKVDKFDQTTLKKTEDNRFYDLTDEDIKNLRTFMLKLPPQPSPKLKILEGLKAGIPIEYLIETKILTPDNLFIYGLDDDVVNYAYDYMKYKGLIESSLDVDEYKKIINTEVVEENEKEQSEILSEEETEIKPETDTEPSTTNKEEIEEITREELAESIRNQLIEEINKELQITFADDIEKLRSQIATLEAISKEKDEQINLLKENERIITEQNESYQNRIKLLTAECNKYKSEINELKKVIFELRKVETIYNSIKDEYEELKQFKFNSDKIIQELKANYEKEIEEYKTLSETYKTSFEELKSMIDRLKESEDVNVYSSHTGTSIPTFYFRVVKKPKYFNSMLKYLRQSLTYYNKKHLFIVFKRVTGIEKGMWADWKFISDLAEDEIVDEVLVDRLDKYNALRLERLISDGKFDVIVALDYYLEDLPLIVGYEVVDICVVEKSEDFNLLSIEGDIDILSEDADSIVDLSYSEKMEKFSNEVIKMHFYRSRLEKLFKKAGVL